MTTTNKTGQLPARQSHGRDQESGRVGEISNMFDISGVALLV